jgi:hypothetical protein
MVRFSPLSAAPLLLFWSILTATTTTKTTVHAQTSSGDPNNCGKKIGTVTPDAIRQAGRLLLEPLLSDPDLLQRSLDIVFFPVTYYLDVFMVCGSCKSHDDWYFTLGKKYPAYHGTYCNATVSEGYQVEHGSIALVPKDPTTGRLPHAVKVRTFLTLPPTKEDAVTMAPTNRFPAGLFDPTSPALDLDFWTTYLPGMVAASAGAIALFPDAPGTGHSLGLMNRTIFHKFNYEQSTAVSFLALQRFVRESTGQCNIVDDAVTVYGIEDGAFGATYATTVLQRFEVRSLTTFLSSGPLDLEVALEDSVSYLEDSTKNDTTSQRVVDTWIKLAAYTFSADIARVANSGNGEILANPLYESALQNAFGPEGGTTILPSNVLDLIDPNFLAQLRDTNISCSNFTTANISIAIGNVPTPNELLPPTSLCEAIRQSSAWPELLGQTDRFWIAPTSACFSDGDEIVSSRNYDNSTRFLWNTGLVDVWQRYTGPLGSSTLTVQGNHATAVHYCSIAPILFFSLEGHQPNAVEDRGNYMEPMTDLRMCQIVTNEPSLQPLVVPTDAPQTKLLTQPPAPAMTPQPTSTFRPTRSPTTPMPTFADLPKIPATTDLPPPPVTSTGAPAVPVNSEESAAAAAGGGAVAGSNSASGSGTNNAAKSSGRRIWTPNSFLLLSSLFGVFLIECA